MFCCLPVIPSYVWVYSHFSYIHLLSVLLRSLLTCHVVSIICQHDSAVFPSQTFLPRVLYFHGEPVAFIRVFLSSLPSLYMCVIFCLLQHYTGYKTNANNYILPSYFSIFTFTFIYIIIFTFTLWILSIEGCSLDVGKMFQCEYGCMGVFAYILKAQEENTSKACLSMWCEC